MIKLAGGIPLLQTKLMPPVVRKNIVQRSNLVERIEKGIDQGFILVSAPPGYGKTTLVADWARQSSVPFAWLTLDAHDNDLLTFNRYFTVMLEKIAILPNQVEDELPSEMNAVEVLRLLFTSLINQLAKSESDVSLIFDDFQVITNPQLYEAIAFLLDHFPPHLRLILITRVNPPIPLAKLRARQAVLEIHAADLAFSLLETQQFLITHRSPELTLQQVRTQYEKTEGWITGLELASLTLGKSSMIDHPGIMISDNSNLTLEYLVDEVIDQLPASTQGFLLRTSLLQNLYGPLCDYILEPFSDSQDGRAILHELYHNNLFLTSLDADEHWFRYHSLFAEALRHLFNERHPGEASQIYLRASEWCDQNNLPEEALNYAAAAGDGDRIVMLLEKYTLRAIHQNRFLDILGRVRQTDEKLLETSALLSMIYSWECVLSFDLEAGERWLINASQLMKDPVKSANFKEDEEFVGGLITSCQSTLAAFRGEMNDAMELAARALNVLLPENDFARSFALLNQGLALSLNGEPNRAIEVLQDAIRAGRTSGNWFVMLFARSTLGEILIDAGQLSRALAVFSQSMHFFASSHGQFKVFEKVVYKEMAEIFMARNELDRASEVLQKSMEPNPAGSMPINEFDTHLRLARLYQCKGDLAQVNKEVALARQFTIGSSSSLDDLLLAIFETRTALLYNQPATAQRWAQILGGVIDGGAFVMKGIPPSIMDNVSLLIERYNLVEGRLKGDKDQIQKAINGLENLLNPLDRAGLMEHKIEANVLLALAYHELENSQKMILHLEAALQIAEPEEYRQVFIDEGIPMSRLLVHYLAYLKQNKHGQESSSRAFVADLLFRLTAGDQENRVLPSKVPEITHHDNWVGELLTPREHEVLQLVSKGRTNSEIAYDLHISINTVKRHMNNIFMKLGVSTRTQAIRVGQTKELIN